MFPAHQRVGAWQRSGYNDAGKHSEMSGGYAPIKRRTPFWGGLADWDAPCVACPPSAPPSAASSAPTSAIPTLSLLLFVTIIRHRPSHPRLAWGDCNILAIFAHPPLG
jgi:hypothetical protein